MVTMNLDDPTSFQSLDPDNMMAEIAGLPDQLRSAWALGASQPLPAWQGLERVVIAGMGGSAIAADLLAAYLQPVCQVPVFVQRDYGLPAWAFGPETLLIASSHSGNTEETVEAYETGMRNNCRLMLITTGGQLASRAVEIGAPVWKFIHNSQPRAAVGFSFGLLLAVFTRLGLVPDPSAEIDSAVAEMRTQQKQLCPEMPVNQNHAKRMAGQLVGRWVNVLGAGLLAPVARRWKGQFNELAKAAAGFDTLPEADHNTLAGLTNPSGVLSRTTTVFLRCRSDHPRNLLRSQLTRQTFMLAGLNTIEYNAPGENPLAQQWSALHFGDHLAYYLALAYGEDPTPIPSIQNFKRLMG
jgi:glucose/mannose-6-phosphate isomerase